MALDIDIMTGYHDYLCDLMRLDLPEHRKYTELMYDLDDKEFFWLHPMDENRDIDAFDLRKEYLRENGIDDFNGLSEPRSCLEVLAAFSRRIEIEITGEPGNDHIERWFWVMLDNLGLLEFDDRHYNHGLVEHILDVWLTRNYKNDGNGGIFP